MEAFDILFDDPPAGAGALHLAQVDPALIGHAAGQRRCFDPPAAGLAVALAGRRRGLWLRASWGLLNLGLCFGSVTCNCLRATFFGWCLLCARCRRAGRL